MKNPFANLFKKKPKGDENTPIPQSQDKKKKDKCIVFVEATNSKACAAVKENISKTRKKIVKLKNNILSKSKIEDLAKQSGLIRR